MASAASSHSTWDAIELKLEVTVSLVASVPDELVDRGRMEGVVDSDNVLVVVLMDSTEDSRYESLMGPLNPPSSREAPEGDI